MNQDESRYLGQEKVSTLLFKFAIPCIAIGITLFDHPFFVTNDHSHSGREFHLS